MRKKMIIAWIIILPLIFSLGIFSGHYKTFPFDILSETKSMLFTDDNSTDDFQIFENDINSLIDITNESEIFQLRSSLINYIWKEEIPPSLIPQEIHESIFDSNYEDLKNLKQIDKFIVLMDYDVKSTAYLFVAENSNNNLIIYHQGHAGDFLNGKKTIQFFLDKGYSILAFSMPLLGMNNQPIVDTSNFGKIKLASHEYLKFLQSDEFTPIKFFIEPIFVSLNYIDSQFNFESYTFVGISGGGWTAILYSAIDDRISNTYSIAGSVPIYYRSIQQNFGDYEQTLPELYSIANYLELYMMSSYGDNRKLLQIFNKYDPCCFSGNQNYSYENILKEKLSDIDGSFEIFIDDTHKEHKISDTVLKLIDKSIFSN